MRNKIKITRLLIIGILLLLPINSIAQANKKTTNKKTDSKTNTKTDPKKNTKTDPKKTTKTDPKKNTKPDNKTTTNEQNTTADYQKQAEELIQFLEGTLNELGSSETPVSEKQIMINESYTRIFVDDKVQVEDDLDENREIYTYKGVQAYLQDIDFFFKDVTFKFKIQSVENLKNNDGEIVYKFKTSRYLKGIGLKNDSVNSILDRYIEINYNENDQSMKIVSMYTTKLNESEEVTKWWAGLSPEWQKILKDKNAQSDPIDYNKLKIILRTTDLDISNNQNIIDLNPLEKLTKLKRLDCSNTKIKDLYPVRSSNKLEVVNCSNTGISSIEPLQYASGLTDLFIENTKVENITTIENFANLKKLSIENTNVKNIESIAECSQLEDLRMSGTKVDSLNAIKELSELKILRINSLPVSSLDNLKNNTKLEQLSISATKIGDISLLSSFKNLQILYINNTGVNDILPLKSNTKLEKVYCDNTGIDAAKASEFMSKMPNCLVMYNSDILKKWWEEMSPEWKSLFDNELKTANPSSEQLHKLSLLKELKISAKPEINSLEPASKFTHLTSIDLSGTAISDLSPLKNLVDLKKINCSNSKITKLDDLAGLKRLEQIDISKTIVASLAPLAGCDNLEIVNAENTQILKVNELSKLTKLKKIYADNSLLKKEAVLVFNLVNPSCLVIYRTEELKKWWNLVEDDWKKIFKQYVGFDDKISNEQLQQITTLREIDVKGFTEIRSLKPLEMLPYIEVLKFSDTRINDLIAIIELKNLKELICPRNPISSIEAISGLKKLEIIDFSNTLITELDPIADLNTLTVIKVSGTKIGSLKALENKNALVHLDISGTKVLFINPIMNLEKLRVLKCYNTRILGMSINKFKENNPDCEVIK